MKRIIVIIALLASVKCGMWAQDTIRQRPAPLSNYFWNIWIDTNSEPIGVGYKMTVGNVQVCARQFVTEDTLQIYGIAAMMVDDYFPHCWYPMHVPGDTHLYTIQDMLNIEYPEDPSFNNLEESLLLFQYHGPDATATMNQLGDSLHVSYLQTPPSYYMVSYRQPLASYADTLPKPVYERYFTDPQTVHDTFFAGFTQGQWKYNKGTGAWYEYRPPFCPIAFSNMYPELYFSYIDEFAFLRQEFPDAPLYWEFRRNSFRESYFLFPILTPEDTTTNGGDTTIVNPNDTTNVNPGDTTIVNPNDTIVLGNDTIAMGDTLIVCDTTIIGGDTIVNYDTILSIVQADLLQRFTGVMPNPAAEKARVVSSFGMSMVKVYNASGALVHTQRADGLYVDLDVSRWPSGTYLVRIHTPQGIATKRLVVSR